MLIAGAMCGGKIRIEDVMPEHFSAVTARLEDCGAKLIIGKDFIELTAPKSIKPVDVTTAVYPGFPTDMQAQWISLMTIAKRRRSPVHLCFRQGP